MTATELRAALDSLGLTMAEAARRWNVPYRTMQGWCTKDTEHPNYRRAPGMVEHVIRLESGAVQPLQGETR